MKKLIKQTGYILVMLVVISVVGCGSDEEVNNPTTKTNPNVKTFDSIWVEEDSSLASFTGINLLDGINTTGVFYLRDCSLRDSGSSGINFFLRSGIFDILDPGFQSRWFRAYDDLTKERFDTISYLDVGGTLDSLDFTEESTEFWGYFNAPLATHPVFCFWLNGKKYANLTNGKNVYGILWPIESSDNNPGNVYGYKMSFRIRININGENDFRKIIPAD